MHQLAVSKGALHKLAVTKDTLELCQLALSKVALHLLVVTKDTLELCQLAMSKKPPAGPLVPSDSPGRPRQSQKSNK